MQLKIFTIPLTADGDPLEDMNKFLRSVKVLEIEKQFVNSGLGAFWTICVTYIPNVGDEPKVNSSPKKDYKKLLSEEQFKMFSELRTIRKVMADNDSIPAYAVFTDAELAEITKLTTLDAKTLMTINGIGEKRVEKYGEELCNRYNTLHPKDESPQETSENK